MKNPRLRMHRSISGWLFAATALLLCACGGPEQAAEGTAAGPESGPTAQFERTGELEAPQLDEASGLQAGAGGVFYVHDDERTRLFVIDSTGRDLASFEIEGASNRDWEDITRVPGPDGPLLVLADIGDNHGLRKQVSLYFVREPVGVTDSGALPLQHRLRFSYPDGPRDAESLAYDAAGGRLLVLTKRDHPPRLYALPLDLAMWEDELQAEFLAEVPGFRPPTRADFLRNPGRGLWLSQPTGMDIAPNGRQAAVITYRSLYLFERVGNESWAAALQGTPREVIGPPGSYDEAVTFSLDGRGVYVTTERRPAPLWRLELNSP